MQKIYQVDAFAARPLAGNPAAVVPLKAWLPTETMQAIAGENNLAETAFFVPPESMADDRRAAAEAAGGVDYDLRWFTPELEVDLCGHATLATAHTIFNHLDFSKPTVRFWCNSGILEVKRADDGSLEMDFPAYNAEPHDPNAPLADCLGSLPSEVRLAWAWLAVFDHEEQVAALKPDFRAMKHLITPGVKDVRVIATAPADGKAGRAGVDFVSRFFAPAAGIDEDHATGSAHCMLTPYWATRLGKPALRARQISKRVGEFRVEYRPDEGEAPGRVTLAGNAHTVIVGDLLVD